MTCTEHNNLVRNIPLIVHGSERYNHDDTLKYIKSIIAYNGLPEIKKPIEYEKLMKPLDKNGVNRGKFQQLTTDELRSCLNEGARLVSAIRCIDLEEAYVNAERIRIATELRNQTPVEVNITQERITQKAQWIYSKGKFFAYCKAIFGKVWYKDAYILQGIMYDALTFKIANEEHGLHCHIAGETQSGKSDSCRAALKFIPAYNRLIQTFTPKWVFYAQDKLHDDMIIFSDDTIFDEETAKLYRGILTNWNESDVRGTVINQKSEDLRIPKHLSFILTSVDDVCEQSADGQDESRFMTMEIKRSEDDEIAIRKFMQQPRPDVSKHMELIYEIWKIIPKVDVIIHKEIVKELPFREFQRYLTLLRCNAMMNGRTTTTESDITEVDQFLTYTKPMVDSKTGALTRNEKVILQFMTRRPQSANDLKVASGLPMVSVFKALRGKEGSMDRPSGGLLLKEKTLQMTYNRDVNAYQFNL